MSKQAMDTGFLKRLNAHRAGWASAQRPANIEQPGPGQESVWDYPRPPEIRPAEAPLSIVFAGQVIATTDRGLRVCETAGAPVYFFPPEDVRTDVLHYHPQPASFCEWKGEAVYIDLVLGDRLGERAAFTYPDPLDDLGRGFDRIAGWIAFYAGRVDEAWVGEELAKPQPGGFYAGWVTRRITGPIKGSPGTEGW
ncbi:MAG: DUF427 domain-containing protein [Pseudomonadota bacterium]